MAKRRLLTREEILAAKDFKTEEVDVPEWGGPVLVREFGVNDGETVGRLWREHKAACPDDLFLPVGLRARVAAMGICDEDGNRLFGDEDLAGKHDRAVERIYPVVMRLSGMWREEPAAAKEGEPEGETKPGASGDSVTA